MCRYFDQSCLGVGNWSSVREASFSALMPGAVVKDKPVAVGRENKRDIEGDSIVEGLLHAVADAVVVVLGLDDGDRNIGLVIKDVVGALGLAARYQFAADDDAPLGESDLLADLHHPVPARAFDGGTDELGADVALAEVFLVHAVICLFHAQAPSAFP